MYVGQIPELSLLAAESDNNIYPLAMICGLVFSPIFRLVHQGV